MELTPQYTDNRGTIYLRDDPKARAAKGGKPILMFEGCEIARSNSAWIPKVFHDGSKGEYRTEFILYRSDSKYYLNVLGTSKNIDDQTFSRVIEFTTPQQALGIIENEEDDRLYMSEPIVALLLNTAQSNLIDTAERNIWLKLMASAE